MDRISYIRLDMPISRSCVARRGGGNACVCMCIGSKARNDEAALFITRYNIVFRLEAIYGWVLCFKAHKWYHCPYRTCITWLQTTYCSCLQPRLPAMPIRNTTDAKSVISRDHGLHGNLTASQLVLCAAVHTATAPAPRRVGVLG